MCWYNFIAEKDGESMPKIQTHGNQVVYNQKKVCATCHGNLEEIDKSFSLFETVMGFQMLFYQSFKKSKRGPNK